MLEALLIACAFALLQWWSSPWSYVAAGILLLLCLPGVFVMRGAAPFVSTPRSTMQAMLRLAAIRPGERVVDLGCGDGRLVFAAAKEEASATGYEMSVPAYIIAKARSLFHPGARICFGNFWHQNSFTMKDVPAEKKEGDAVLYVKK
ncbi:MAG: putative RNA methylase [Candidatus Peregrinibacteria bacterium Greene0416_62]|nr:MAG: putative RNA methylase [Candidatus Peregrinibacteria bacterium Greene0416_62]